MVMKQRVGTRLLRPTLIMLVLLLPVQALAASPGTWVNTGSMNARRAEPAATLLPDGEVLAEGGTGALAELYNPSTGTWAPTGSMTTNRSGHAATLLANNQVLVEGGFDGQHDLATAELYNPSTGTWAPTGSMATGRRGHNATLLPNGKVLVEGGDQANSLSASAELYDPSTAMWAPTGSMTTVRDGHTATLLPNGQVLVVGGRIDTSASSIATAELYDPSTGTWTRTGSMTASRDGHAATLLANNQVLVEGGNGMGFQSGELYDVADRTWTRLSALMTTPRALHTATLLGNGQVAVAGGSIGLLNQGIAETDVYDPTSQSWVTPAAMNQGRHGQAATLLLDGTVLVNGGLAQPRNPPFTSAELYTPLNPQVLPTSCTLAASGVDSSGRAFSAVATRDILSGLRSVRVLESINALVALPEFPLRFRDPGVVLATRTNPTQPATLRLEVTNGDSQTITCGFPIGASAPKTSATVVPAPNGAGWNRTALTVTLTTTDEPGGSVVKEITYSATGAQPIWTTVVAGSSAQIQISTEGQTTLTYSATDVGGDAEMPKTLTIMLDKTPPAVSFAAPSPPANANGWNNTDVTIPCTPADALSGVATVIPACPLLLTAAGATVTGTVAVTDVAGNAATFTSPALKIDKTPPQTTAVANPAPNNAGWNNTNVAVTLSGSDSLSGVDNTEYNLDAAGWTAYAGSVAITTEGVHTLHYRSVDKASNVEIAQQLNVKIDKTLPEAFAQFDTTRKNLMVFGKDAGSGIPAGPVAPSSVTPTSWSTDQDDDTRARDQDHDAELRSYLISDLAGNTTMLALKVRTAHHETDRLEAQFVSIQYGSAVPIKFAQNLEAFDLQLGENTAVRSLEQQVRVGVGKQRQTIDADFEARKNTTEIEAQSQGKHQHLTKLGLDLIHILTSKGQLSIVY